MSSKKVDSGTCYNRKMKKPIIRAVAAVAYIVVIVFVVNAVTQALPRQTIFIPMAMLGLFVLSAAVIGYLFIYEPFILHSGGKKEEAVKDFLQTVGIFACFVAIFVALLFLS